MSYEVGDKVIIKNRIGCSEDYPFGFIQEMADRAGETVKIISKEKSCNTDGTYPGDGFKYQITPDDHSFSWASSMFEPIVKQSNIKTNKKHIVKLNFNL